MTILIVTCFEKFARRRLAHAGRHRAPGRALLRDQAALQPRRRAPSGGSTSSSPTRCADARTMPKPSVGEPRRGRGAVAHRPQQPVAILFVGGYGGLGRHALLTLLRMFPRALQGHRLLLGRGHRLGRFKGIDEVHELETPHARGARQVRASTRRWLGLPAESAFSTGIEVAVEAEKLGTRADPEVPARASSSPGSSSSTKTPSSRGSCTTRPRSSSSGACSTRASPWSCCPCA